MKESLIVKHIEKQFNSVNRFYVNIHGSYLSKNGTPDFITMDCDSNFVGLEVKNKDSFPTVNQWRKCIEILLSNGRYIVGKEDFDLSNMDNKTLPIVRIGNTIGESEFSVSRLSLPSSFEVKLNE